MKNSIPLTLLCVTLILSACTANATPTAIPTLVLEDTNANPNAAQPPASSGETVSASGVIVPARDAQLAFALAANVSQVNVAEGDQVQEGQVLAELDNTSIQVEVEQAERLLRELTSPAAIAAAEQAIVTAQKAYEDAQKKVDSINYRKNNQSDIEYYKAQLVLAQKNLDRAREAYNKTRKLSAADPVRAAATTNLYNAQKAYNTALWNLEWFTNTPEGDEVNLAKANLDAAAAALQDAQWYASELKGESVPADATGAQLAKLQQARDNLKAAQDRLEHTRLIAPFSGTVITVNLAAGEYVVPGQAVISLSDVTNLQAETTDLSERDVAHVSVGQKASIYIEALNVEVNGHVTAISPVANTLGGDVVYKTTIVLDELPEGVRAGMTVTVQYLP